MEEQTQQSAEKIGGMLTLLAGLMWIVIQMTHFSPVNDITRLNETITAIIKNLNYFVINMVAELLLIIILVGVAAIYFLLLRFYHAVLSYFISFGMLATFIAFIVALSADLSALSLLKEYQITTGIEHEMLSINILAMLQFQLKATTIAKTLFSLSACFMVLFIFKTRIFSIMYAMLFLLSGLILLYTTWLLPDSLIDNIANISMAMLFSILGILFIKHSQLKS